MGRRKKGLPIHGWLVIDKPLEMSSNSVVGKSRWLTKAQKVGHGGTLDPLATGVLPLAFGEATKTVSFVMDGLKTYRFQVTWGEARNTDDLEGEVISKSEKRPSQDEIIKILPDFIGTISQVPPKFSALKIEGQRAYKLAREDKDVEMTPRDVEIHDLKLLDCPSANQANFEVSCGKGTYVRALGRDFGQKLGCLGYISELRRIKVGPFQENGAISLDILEDIVHSGALSEQLLSIETVLDDIPALALLIEDAKRIKQGMALDFSPLSHQLDALDLKQDHDVILLKCDDQAVALARISDGFVRPFRVFNL